METSAPPQDTRHRPRPEAVALHWDELLHPTQTAMQEVINWLLAALDSSRAKWRETQGSSTPSLHEQLATSVLVAGDRGFGKTTILLTLADAIRQPREFLAPVRPSSGEGRRASTEEVEKHPLYLPLERLGKYLVLLTPLDMEPLPPDANLLATLLVRVRDALSLDPANSERERLASPVLLEEGVDEPWGQLDQLVRDATFMWEDIPVQGQDPRQRAEYQLRSAELYARFQGRFHKALESVSRHLFRRRFGYDAKDEGGVILVLPIDNVDRSTQHLHLILKLTRMVASRRLCFLLASGRQEFQLFLEKTFHRELTESGRAMLDPGTQDQTLAIARRQAAAAMRRVLPEPHRIEIRILSPEETWKFCAPGSLLGKAYSDTPLCELLAKIPLPCPKGDVSKAGKDTMTFADLFDLRGWLSSKPSPVPILTLAARQALTTSARTALDLWQAALNAASRNENGQEEEPAISIARQMLLMSIDESDLPSWASEQFLHRIISSDRSKHTVLDLIGMPIKRLKRTWLAHIMPMTPLFLDSQGPQPSPDRILRSELHARYFNDVILELHDLEHPGRRVPLPRNVSGWFMLLHDLLMITDAQRVLNVQMMPLEVMPELVVSQHEAKLQDDFLFELNLWWIPPEWATFLDFFIFTHQWMEECIRPLFQLEVERARLFPLSEHPNAYRLRYVLAAWIDNACSVARKKQGEWSPLPTRRTHAIRYEHFKKWVTAYEARTARNLRALLWNIETMPSEARQWIALRWVIYSLPLMLNSDFLPEAITKNLWNCIQDALGLNGPNSFIWKYELLQRRRFEMVRAVIQRSDAYRRHEELFNRDAGPGALEARRLLLDSCQAWLRAMPGSFEKRLTGSRPSADGATPEPPPPPGKRRRRPTVPRRAEAPRGTRAVRPQTSGKVSRPGEQKGPASGGRRPGGARKRRH